MSGNKRVCHGAPERVRGGLTAINSTGKIYVGGLKSRPGNSLSCG